MQPVGQDTTAKRRPTTFGERPQEVASLPGLEPGTYCLEGSCSVQLSYRDGLAVQLPKSRTIHTGVLRVHSNTSLVPQQVRGAHRSQA
jgi:hypothetical protein